MKVIGYARVSTIGQAKDGLGIPTQERMLRAWAKASGHKLVRIVSENGKSGTLPDSERPGLLDALSALRERDGKREAKGIAVTSLDRLARVLHVQEAVLGKAWALGGTVFTVDGGEVFQDDPDDPMRKAMRQMAGVFAELDKNLIVKRLRNGRATKSARGGHAVGRLPFGYTIDEDGKLVPHPDEKKTLDRILELRARGTSYGAIAATLNAEGVPTRGLREAGEGERSAWHAKTVARIVMRAASPRESTSTRSRSAKAPRTSASV